MLEKAKALIIKNEDNLRILMFILVAVAAMLMKASLPVAILLSLASLVYVVLDVASERGASLRTLSLAVLLNYFSFRAMLDPTAAISLLALSALVVIAEKYRKI